MRRLAVILLLATGLAGCGQAAHKITYKAGGDIASATVTTQDASGAKREMQVSLPWTQDASAPTGQYLFLSVRDKAGMGTMTCEIDVDGAPLRTSTSTKPYAIAVCAGEAGS